MIRASQAWWLKGHESQLPTEGSRSPRRPRLDRFCDRTSREISTRSPRPRSRASCMRRSRTPDARPLSGRPGQPVVPLRRAGRKHGTAEPVRILPKWQPARETVAPCRPWAEGRLD